jgi:Glucodextranase, domain B/FecR protein
VPQTRKSGFHISYITITYRSVFLAIFGVLVLAGVVVYFAFPDASARWMRAGEDLLQRALVKVGLAGNASAGVPGEAGPQQAHFTNIDGTVRVKKISTNTWIKADYNVALEKGDVVQTSSQGIAKVVFTDGTNYTVKPDSLIVVQENSVNSAQQTKVAVEVTTGTVDLATSSLGQGSKSQVIVAGATANLSGETTAEVVNDPRKDDHEILVKKGAAEVSRNGDSVKLGEYERATFKADSPQIGKTKEIGPPTLIAPPNMQPVFVGSNAKPVDFSWTPVDGVRRYRVKISRNPYFSSLVLNPAPEIEATQIQLTNLPEGAYYWAVQSLADDGKESVDSEKNRFTVIPKGQDRMNIGLELAEFSQHGHVIEVRGRTEPSARVMVNGQEVALIAADGSFHHFTTPLPTGENIITVTAQNAKGGVNTITRKVVIQ